MMKNKVNYNLKPRSEIGKLRLRLKQLEDLINKYSLYFEKMNVRDNPLAKYFGWIVNVLDSLQNKIGRSEIDSSLITKLDKYESKITEYLINHKILVDRKSQLYDVYNLNQPNINYVDLSEFNTKLFINVVDPFNIWTEPDKIKNMFKKNGSSLLRYSFAAFMIQLTQSISRIKSSVPYLNSIRLAKEALPYAYSSPTINDIIALSLLAHDSLSQYEVTSAAKYFTMTIRMAQQLKLDKEEVNNFKYESEEDEWKALDKKTKLWKALSFSYAMISTLIPNFPFIRLTSGTLKPLPIQSLNNFHLTISSDNHLLSEFDHFYDNLILKIVKLYVKVICHVYSVKLKHSYGNNFSNIPLKALRLPPNEIKDAFTTLLAIKSDIVYMSQNNSFCSFQPHTFDKSNDETYRKNRNILYNRTLVSFITIYIYYPSVLVHPAPANLPYEEMTILFESSMQIVSLVKLIADAPLSSNFDNAVISKVFKSGHIEYNLNFNLTYFLQSSSAIFTFFNIIDKASFPNLDPVYIPMMKACIDNSLILLESLYTISKLTMSENSFNSIIASTVSPAIDRFALPKDFVNNLKKFL